jgi:hypothetical protein
MLHVFYIGGAVKKLTEFFDINGLMHHKFVLPGQSVTGYFYVQILQRLHDAAEQVAGTVVSAS